MSEFKLGRMILKSLLSQPATTQYPVQPATYHDATKGHVTIKIDRCRFDGSCAMQCPTGALEVDRTGLTWAIDRFRCVQCRNCVNVCVEEALSMENTYAPSATSKHVDVFGLSPEMLAQRRAAEAEKKARAARLREEAAAKKKAAAGAAGAETGAKAETPVETKSAEAAGGPAGEKAEGPAKAPVEAKDAEDAGAPVGKKAKDAEPPQA